MPLSFLPKIIAKSLTDLTPELLRSRKIRLLMLDFDNTIVPYTTSVPTQEMERWLDWVKHSGVQVCVVSNSHKERVKVFCRHYGIDCITHARKPFSQGIRQCLERYGIPARHAALVGDQIFTDTLGANAQGVTSILVKAIHNHNILFKCRHVMELPFIAMAWKRKIENE